MTREIITDHTEPPLTHDLNAGESWGLEYPVISGWRPDRGYWAAWDRHTGEIVGYLPPNPNQHGWDKGKHLIRRFSQPKDYTDHATSEDSVS